MPFSRNNTSRLGKTASAVLALVVLMTMMMATMAVHASPAAEAASRRIVALGDIHGDVQQLRAALTMAELIDADTHEWIGKSSDKLVQVGDMVDRGADDKAVLDFMKNLQKEAAAAGSEVVILMGNHELFNLRQQFHYVHPEGKEAFGGPEAHRRAFATDGEYGAWLRNLPLTHVDMGTLFVHAGLLPEYAKRGLQNLEEAKRKEIAAGDKMARSNDRGANDDVLGVNGPVWTRKLVNNAQNGKCSELRTTLKHLNLERMVVGHTPQSQGTLGAFCDGDLIAIDVGMSKWMYGNLALLEMTEDLATGDVELREVLPHTKVQEEQAEEQAEESGASLEEELLNDPVRLQELYATVKQANEWREDDKAATPLDDGSTADEEL